MAIRSFGFVLAVMVLILVVGSAAGTPNTNLLSGECNTQKIPSGSPFFGTLGNLLGDMVQNTAVNGLDYKTSVAGSGGSPTAYGQAICAALLSESDCAACLANLGGSIWGICSNAIGANVLLGYCLIRYEQYSF